jgi:hypothetical protein
MAFPIARPEKVDRNESGSISPFYHSLISLSKMGGSRGGGGTEISPGERSVDFAKRPFYFMYFEKVEIRTDEMNLTISDYS